MDIAQFAGLLDRMSSSDNAIRKEAEEKYHAITPKDRVQWLVNVIESAHDSMQRFTQASVLLRRIMTSQFDDVFGTNTSVEELQAFRRHMIELLNLPIVRQQGKEGKGAKRKIVEIIGECSRCTHDKYALQLEESQQSQLVNILAVESEFVIQALSQNNDNDNGHFKECALQLLEDNALIGAIEDDTSQYFNQIKRLLCENMRVLTGRNQILCCRATLQTIVCYMIDEEEGKTRRVFQEAIPLVLNCIKSAVQDQQLLNNPSADGDADDYADEILKMLQLFTNILEDGPKLFKPQLVEIFDCFLAVIGNEKVNKDVKDQVLESLVSWCEAAPAVIRKNAGQDRLNALIYQLLALMTKLTDDDEWTDIDPSVDDEKEADEDATLGETSLDRVCIALGGKAIITILLNLSNQLVQNESWQFRHAGIMALSCSAEGLGKEMKNHLQQIVPVVINSMQDPHPRVRYAACNCLGQMATDFASQFQQKHGKAVLPALLATLEGDVHHRVQAHAGCAIVNFMEDGDDQIVSLYADTTLSKLHAVLMQKFDKFGDRKVRILLEAIMVALSSVAEACESQTAKVYSQFVPPLKHILAMAGSKDERLLRGKAIDAFTLIGCTVPKQQFIVDAQEVMNSLLQTQSSGQEVNTANGNTNATSGGDTIETDDPAYHYMLQGWERICQILGKDFAPFLPAVMPRVMKLAGHTPQIKMFDSDDLDDVNEDEWEFVAMDGGHQHFGLKTSGLEDKKEAISMIQKYAEVCQERFIDYLEPVTAVMVSNLRFIYDETVRISAAECLPSLLKVASGAKGAEYQTSMWELVAKELVETMGKEKDSDARAEILECYGDCVDQLSDKNALKADQIDGLLLQAKTIFEDYFKSNQGRQDTRLNDEDYDDDMEESMEKANEGELQNVEKIIQLLEALFKNYGTQMMPFWEQLFPYINKLFQDGQGHQDRVQGLSFLCTLVKYCGVQSRQFVEPFMGAINDSFKGKQAAKLQVSSYLYGLLAEHGNGMYLQECTAIVPELVRRIECHTAKDAQYALATDNAISAITRFMRYLPQTLTAHGSIEEIYSKWISWLPLQQDYEEGSNVYGLLLDGLKTNDANLVGANQSRLPRIVTIIAESLQNGTLNDEDCKHEYECAMQLIPQILEQKSKSPMHFEQLTLEAGASVIEVLTQHYEDYLSDKQQANNTNSQQHQ